VSQSDELLDELSHRAARVASNAWPVSRYSLDVDEKETNQLCAKELLWTQSEDAERTRFWQIKPLLLLQRVMSTLRLHLPELKLKLEGVGAGCVE
jgi:hypothetical protein